MEEFSILLSLAEHRDPRESCLRSLKSQELEQDLIVVYRHSPLVVMVIDVELVGRTAPRAPSLLHILPIKKSLRSHEIYSIPEDTHTTEGDEEEFFHITRFLAFGSLPHLASPVQSHVRP